MQAAHSFWLVANASSGSNDDTAHLALAEAVTRSGLNISRRIDFPREELPTPAQLDEADISMLAVFAGDGTVNAVIDALDDWQGAVLVLPGGTMNLLYLRLHGNREMADVLQDAANGHLARRRPGIIRTSAGSALAGLMAGPGTSWNRVREAMREKAVLDVAGEAVSALDETLSAAMIAVKNPPAGRPEGYPLVLLTPREKGIEIAGFRAESLAEYLAQGIALLSRDFRQGPHDRLGQVRRIVLSSCDGEAIGVLIDGEPAELDSQAEFVLAACAVDLLASPDDG